VGRETGGFYVVVGAGRGGMGKKGSPQLSGSLYFPNGRGKNSFSEFVTGVKIFVRDSTSEREGRNNDWFLPQTCLDFLLRCGNVPGRVPFFLAGRGWTSPKLLREFVCRRRAGEQKGADFP